MRTFKKEEFTSKTVSEKDLTDLDVIVYESYKEREFIGAKKILDIMGGFEEVFAIRKNPYADLISSADDYWTFYIDFAKNVVWDELKELLKQELNNEISYEDFSKLMFKANTWGDIYYGLDNEFLVRITKEQRDNLCEVAVIAKEIPNSCYKYFSHIHHRMIEGKRYVVIAINTESSGEARIFGETLEDVAAAWKTIFENQPKEMPYYRASYLLNGYNYEFPEDERGNLIGINFNPNTFWQDAIKAEDEYSKSFEKEQ